MAQWLNRGDLSMSLPTLRFRIQFNSKGIYCHWKYNMKTKQYYTDKIINKVYRI